MENDNWTFKIDVNIGNLQLNLQTEGTQQSILTTLRNMYGIFEPRLKSLAEATPGTRPAGLLDDAFMLLRCLILNRLEPHASGKFIQIVRKH
ncbi:MAG: hypothetical protein WCB68_21600 [Pyrinomonadaceae bacterium]